MGRAGGGNLLAPTSLVRRCWLGGFGSRTIPATSCAFRLRGGVFLGLLRSSSLNSGHVALQLVGVWRTAGGGVPVITFSVTRCILGDSGPLLFLVALYLCSAIILPRAGSLSLMFLTLDTSCWDRLGSAGDSLGGEAAPAGVEGLRDVGEGLCHGWDAIGGDMLRLLPVGERLDLAVVPASARVPSDCPQGGSGGPLVAGPLLGLLPRSVVPEWQKRRFPCFLLRHCERSAVPAWKCLEVATEGVPRLSCVGSGGLGWCRPT